MLEYIIPGTYWDFEAPTEVFLAKLGGFDKRPELAVFHNLPSGGGINASKILIQGLMDKFLVTVHSPEGSYPLSLPVRSRRWSFPLSRRISGIRRLAAPVILPARLKAFDQLCRRIAAEINMSADIVLVHNSMYLAAPPLLRYLNVPSLYFCYEYPRHLYEPALVKRTRNRFFHMLLRHLRKIERIRDREATLSADKVVTLSSWMKKRLRDIYGIEASVVRPGIDTDFFRADETTEKSNTVLSVGALWPFKGHEMAIETVSLVKQNIRPALVIVADREYPGYNERLRKSAIDRGVDLILRRGVSNEELRTLYRKSKVVLCCQHDEPYGLVPLEAMSCGVPVIAVEEGGFVDNIRSGENGILVKRDAAEMAAVLSRILTDRQYEKDLIDGGRKFVSVRSAAEGVKNLAYILDGMLH